MDKFVSVKEAANICGVSYPAMSRYIKTAVVEGAILKGGKWSIPLHKVEEFDFKGNHSLRAPKAATFLGVELEELWWLLDQGKIYGREHNDEWYFSYNSLDRYMRGESNVL